MTLPASGNPISFSQINTELSLGPLPGRSSSAQLSMSDTSLRNLLNDTSGDISISSGYSKTTAITIENPNTYTGKSDDFFGSSCAAYGDYAVIGAFNADSSTYANAGYVYVYNIRTGALIHTIANPSPSSTNRYFGTQVAAWGNKFAASTHDGYGLGKVYVFSLTSGSLLFTFTNPNPDTYSTVDDYGYWNSGLSMSDYYLIVGAPSEDNSSLSMYSSGRAFIFNLISGTLDYTLTRPSGAANYALFGKSVAINNSYALIGSDTGLQAGVVHVFNLGTGNYDRVISNPNLYGSATTDGFGERMVMNGNNCLIAAAGENTTNVTGVVHLYDYTTGVRTRTFSITKTSADSGLNPTYRLALNGTHALLSDYGYAYYDGTMTYSSVGKAWLYKLSDGSLVQTFTNPAGATAGGTYFSSSVALTDTHAVFGSERYGGSYQGRAYIRQVL